MWGDPAAHVGVPYRQEYRPRVAEDMGRVVALRERARVPNGTYTDCVRTEDTTPLEPDVREQKIYCRNVGMVKEVETPRAGSVLVEVRRP